jgi:protein-tyrosine phosphatase
MRLLMRSRLLIKLLLAMALLAGTADGLDAGTGARPTKRVLFICTGNYYRSRFAEALFNEKAAQAGLDWRASSRGLRLEASQHGVSIFTREQLLKRGVPAKLFRGEPKALTEADLAKSDYVVCMDEAEHRPMMEKQFPHRDEHTIHYWHVAETDEADIPRACATMAADVDELVKALGR